MWSIHSRFQRYKNYKNQPRNTTAIKKKQSGIFFSETMCKPIIKLKESETKETQETAEMFKLTKLNISPIRRSFLLWDITAESLLHKHCILMNLQVRTDCCDCYVTTFSQWSSTIDRMRDKNDACMKVNADIRNYYITVYVLVFWNAKISKRYICVAKLL